MSDLASGVAVGPYELVEMIGQTGMSQVWKARDSFGSVVALKTMTSATDSDQHLRARFLREGGEHMLLKHPCIVPIIDFFEQDDNIYLVMQYIPGGSLEDRMERRGWQPLAIEEAVGIARQVLSALDYAHQRLIVHRDVKPSNILLHGDRAFLSDFGIALSLSRPRLTIVEQLIGTRSYMSPEQIQTPLLIDHLSDVYSFGCVLYEMLTGHEPYPIDEAASSSAQYQMLAKRIYEPPVAPTHWNPQIPPRLERILLTSLSVNPQDRFSGCGSFMRALEALQSDKEPPTPALAPVPAPAPVPKPAPAEQKTEKAPPKALEPAKASAGAVFGVLVLGLFWIVVAANGGDKVLIAITILAIAANFPVLWILHRGWSSLSRSLKKNSPGRNVWPLLIPLFNLYWCWESFVGFARCYKAALKHFAPEERPVSDAFYKVFVLLTFYLPIAVWLLRVDLMKFVLLLQMLVLFPIMAGMLSKAVRRLAPSAAARAAASQSAQVAS